MAPSLLMELVLPSISSVFKSVVSSDSLYSVPFSMPRLLLFFKHFSSFPKLISKVHSYVYQTLFLPSQLSPTTLLTITGTLISIYEHFYYHPFLMLSQIFFLWVHGHSGILGNEEADRLANLAIEQGEYIDLIPESELLTLAKSFSRNF